MNQPPVESRPDFDPPAQPEPRSAVQDDAAPARRRIGTGRVLARVVTLVVLAAVAGTLYLANRDPGTSIIGGTHRPSSARPTLTHPLPTRGNRPADPLLQQSWSSGDDVYPMDLSDLPFSFRAPGSWGCLASSQAGVRWVCMDETGLINGTRPADPSSGIIESDECRAPCSSADYTDVLGRLRALGIDTAGLHVADKRTRVDDRVDPADPSLHWYRMSRTYDSDGDGRLDRHLWVQFELNAADRVPVQKMLGDLYDATR